MKKKNTYTVSITIIVIFLVLIIIYLFVPFKDNGFLQKMYSPVCGIKNLYQGEEYLPAWCLDPKSEEQEVEDIEEEEEDDNNDDIGLANPAAVKCLDDGGTLEAYMTEEGAAALCVFEDNSICNQWDYFRGDCDPGDCEKVCDEIDTRDEGWYNSCTNDLIKLEECGEEEDEEGLEDEEEDEEPVKELNIKIDRPSDNEQLSSPFTVEGQAKVYENDVYVRVTSKDGRVLIEEQTTANYSDAGQWGDFDIDIDYEFSLTKEGYVEIYSLSAKDGSEENLIQIPVKF